MLKGDTKLTPGSGKMKAGPLGFFLCIQANAAGGESEPSHRSEHTLLLPQETQAARPAPAGCPPRLRSALHRARLTVTPACPD